MADEAIQRGGAVMKRRGILRAAGTAVGVVLAGIAAKQTAQPIAALDITTAEQFQGIHQTGLPHFVSEGPGSGACFYAFGTADQGFLAGASANFGKGVSGHGIDYGVYG